MFCIVANIKSDRVFRTNAKVYILSANQGANSADVSGLSRGGRRVRKFVPYKRMENFRAAWVPPHMQEGKAPFQYVVQCWWHDKAAAQDAADKLAEIWSGVRYFDKYGDSLMQDGTTVGVAYKRAVEIGADDGQCISCIPMDFMYAGHKTHRRFAPIDAAKENHEKDHRSDSTDAGKEKES